MKDNVDKKQAVSPSGSLICSADAVQENAERKTPEQIAHELIIRYVSEEYAITHLALENRIALEIREAVEAEREACLQIAKDYNELEAREFMSVYHAERVSDAISLNRK